MLGHMELTRRLLEQFVAVARVGHIGRAAAQLSMSQPPLTQAIHRLERGLGVALFTRTPRGVELTAPGRCLLDDAQRMLDHHDGAIRRVRRVAAGLQGELAVGYAVSLAYRVVPDMLRATAAEVSGLRVRAVQMQAAALPEAVRSGRVDMALTRGPIGDAGGLEIVDIARERFAIAAPQSHDLATRTTVRLSDLAGVPLVLPSHTAVPGLRGRLQSVLDQTGAELEVIDELDELAGLMTYPIAGLAMALIPGEMTTLRHPDVAYLAIADDHVDLDSHILAIRRSEPDAAIDNVLALMI
jgi:DNA-binding transcriptional LysR family regulator